MIDFSTLQGLTIPEGVVTQIAKDGVVLWKLETSKPVILEVEKTVADTYAGETTYTAEEFVLLEVYPKTNGSVNVTYGGLTKTIIDTSGVEKPNSQKVFFGTFNGVSDSVETPTSGSLIIEGDYYAFGCGLYTYNEKGLSKSSQCITNVVDWGDVEIIPMSAFEFCSKLGPIYLPNNIKSIGSNAFYSCENLVLTSLPSKITSIGSQAFYSCANVCIQTFPEGLVSIGDSAFEMLTVGDGDPNTSMYGLTIVLPSTLQSIGNLAFRAGYDLGGSVQGYLGGVKLLAKTPPAVPEGDLDEKDPFPINSDFNSTFKATIPVGCLDAYKADSYWSHFGTKLVEG